MRYLIATMLCMWAAGCGADCEPDEHCHADALELCLDQPEDYRPICYVEYRRIVDQDPCELICTEALDHCCSPLEYNDCMVMCVTYAY